MAIDTHRIFKRLTEAGVSQAESEALVETARELSDAPTRGDLRELAAITKADLHKALHAQSWRFLGLMGLQTAILLSAGYYLLSDIKADVREIRNRVGELSKTR
jgi:hypothetical protein